MSRGTNDVPMDKVLAARLEELRQKQLFRELRRVDSAQQSRMVIHGRELLNFSSNDYLGLANDSRLKNAAAAAVEQYGAGSGASRLISGSLAIHHQLEEGLARFKGTEAALVFSSGYAAALGTIAALVTKNDFVVIDRLVHASIVDAARLSGATLRVFRHNELDDLRNILTWCRKQPGSGREILVITESLFSMDGDFAPLKEIVRLKEEFGAWLMLDEAHATGLFGARRQGRGEQEGLTERVDIQMATLGKALGSSGGFVAGSSTLIGYLVNRARSFIFSTAPSPAASGAALAALEVIRSDEGAQRLGTLRERIAEIKSITSGAAGTGKHSPILPLMIGDEARAVEVSRRLIECGVLIPAIRYPTVARGKARLRITCSASHTPEDVRTLADALKSIL